MPKKAQLFDNCQELQQILSYSFNDMVLLRKAITHKSFASEKGGAEEDNEVLEFLGDAVLELCVSQMLFERFGSALTEGEYTKLRAFLVNKNQISSLAKGLGLNRYVLLGIGEARQQGSAKKSILANVFEAVLGAIYLDGGIQPAREFVNRCYKDLLADISFPASFKDHKSKLQEFTQTRYQERPVYVVLQDTGPDHDKRFEIGVEFKGNIIAKGSGKSKKEAAQEAAKKALEYLMKGDQLV